MENFKAYIQICEFLAKEAEDLPKLEHRIQGNWFLFGY